MRVRRLKELYCSITSFPLNSIGTMRYVLCLPVLAGLSLLLGGCGLLRSEFTPGEQPPLQESSWTITSIHGTTEVADRYGSTLTFDEASSFTGVAACNTYDGSVQADPGRGEVRLDVERITEKNCHDGGYETELLDALKSATYYNMQGNTLTLYTQESNRVLRFSEK